MLHVSKHSIMLLPAVQDAVTLTLTYLYVAWPHLYMLVYNLITCALKKKNLCEMGKILLLNDMRNHSVLLLLKGDIAVTLRKLDLFFIQLYSYTFTLMPF